MTRSLHLRHRVGLPPDQVVAWLGDMDRLVSIHPLLSAAHRLPDSLHGPGWYRVRERVARGPLPLHFTYPARLEVDMAGRLVQIHARIWRVIHVTMQFEVYPDPERGSGRSLVEETVIFRSPLPVAGIMGEVFRKEHAALFVAMEACALQSGAT